MRISLNWLRELVNFTLSPEAIADLLTMAGFEVEDIEDRRTWAAGVVVGKVLERQPHPNADKLSVCTVDIGAADPSTIVCGAANVATGLWVPVATLGAFLPQVGEAGLKIKPAKLRGVESKGMICSLAELGLIKESEGIHSFAPEGLAPGMDVRPLLGLDDVILDLTSTANRADALSMVGIAREVAALTGLPLKLPQPGAIAVPPADGAGSQRLALNISEAQACPAYIGTVLEGLQIGPSPLWLQQRLQAAGTRPINNVVDVTNYILLEWGQPLHAFDRDALLAVGTATTGRPAASDGADLQVGVRFAEAGETLKTLDSQERPLTEQTLLITAGNWPVALAGVMGGAATEVQPETQNLLLEAALFDPAVVRRSARSLGMRTEASARYERGVNQAELEVACARALELLQQLASGTVVSQVTADARSGNLTRSVELRLERVHQVLGDVRLDDEAGTPETGALPASEIERILIALGCVLSPLAAIGKAAAIEGEIEGWTVTVPPYRYRDLEREIDLIEEIARVYGYNNFEETLPAQAEFGYLSIEQMLKRRLREAFRAVGLTEVMHYSLGKPGGDRQIVLRNPLFTEFSALRTDLMGGLIDAFQYNLEQGNGPLNAFEIGQIFWTDEDGLLEAESLGGIMGGDPSQGRWMRSGRSQPMDWFTAKGLLESVLQRLGVAVEFQPDRRDARLHPGRTASLWVNGTRLGTFGQLHPQLLQERGLPDEVYAFELQVDVAFDFMDQESVRVPVFQSYSTYPPSDRDLAFFVATQVSVSDLERTMRKMGGKLLDSISLFDEYRGENVTAGQRSLAFRLVYRAGDRTLTDADIEPIHQNIREALVEKFRVELRS
jgi:phenylalanyl-tRNA synthetase beta chain